MEQRLHLAKAPDETDSDRYLVFTVRFKSGQRVVAEAVGVPKRTSMLSVADVTDKVIDIEQTLERLTGLRVHIESEYVQVTKD